MKVFTTIFLAHPLGASSEGVDRASDLFPDELDLADVEQALRERITVLESSNWFVGDSFDEE
jgi:hypothetical protein